MIKYLGFFEDRASSLVMTDAFVLRHERVRFCICLRFKGLKRRSREASVVESNKIWKSFSASLVEQGDWDDLAVSRPFDDLNLSPKEAAQGLAKRQGVRLLQAYRHAVVLVKHLFFSTLIGVVAGAAGVAFQFAMRWGSTFFLANEAASRAGKSVRALFFLPLGGLAIVFLYRLARLSIDAGTNQIVDSLTGEKKASLWLAPLIFLSSTITQLFGGSAGREGAALQLGGCVGLGTGRLFHLEGHALHIAILCGMSGGFASVFGAPLTAAVFAMEIACVGVVYYPAFLPSLISASIGAAFASAFGFPPFSYHLSAFPSVSVGLMLRAILLGLTSGVVCVFFCSTIRNVGQFFSRRFPNDYWRIAFGGVSVALATVWIGSNAYNGTGLSNVQVALDGRALPLDFVLKTLFTAVTLGAGFKGGEIVPALAVGASFGGCVAHWIGFLPAQGAALGMIAVFCGATNCPLSALILSVELFGAQNALIFAIVCGVCYMTSGKSGLYRSQTLLFSKLTANPFDIRLKKTLLSDLKALERRSH